MRAYAGTKPIKVLHIVGDSCFGGIAQIIFGLGRISKADGWQVDVLATDPIVQQAVQQEALGVVNLDVIRRRIRPFWDLVGLFRLRRFLLREGYSIVHTHTSKAGFIGRLAAWLADVPVIVHTAHGFAFHEQSPAVIRIFYSGLERIASRWCDRIVSVSEFHRRWALELGICVPAKIDAIPNGISPRSRIDPFARAAMRRQLGAEEGDLIILTVARLAPDKGLGYLIEAAAILQRAERRYRVVIAGDGPVRARLEKQVRDCGISDTVTFLGFREDVAGLLAASDLVVQPSLREGLSISLLEAMAAGKPIIATSIGSHLELTSQAEIARLVPPADPDTLAAAILQFSSDPALMARLAITARTLFETHYTEDRMLTAYRQLYRNLLETKAPIHSTSSSWHEPLIRRATAADLTRIVTIHQKAFKNFFVTRLGAPFLRRYYELVLNYPTGIVLVSEEQGGLTGFVCGFRDPGDFYRLMWRNRRAFALPALAALLRHPSLAANLIKAVHRIQTSAAQAPPRSCELSSIAVAPEACGNGLGKALLQAFLQQSWSMDVQSVFLTTDATANEAANAMYREVGFQCARRFLQRRGRWMNEYVFRRAPDDAPVRLQA
jgi:glycosyltransferase involved in cell wall biosynthesis/ribosomal protein S18 acetylase RimI-like enzyme